MIRLSLMFMAPLFLLLSMGCGLIPITVEYTGTESYRGNPFITDAIVVDGVTSIAGAVFRDCTSLKNVTFPSSLTNIGDQAFASCSTLQDLVLPDGLLTIGADAFTGCNLGNVTIPAGVTEIRDHAFTSSHLSRVVVNATTPPTLGSSFVFAGNDANLVILVPAGSVTAYLASTWGSYASNIRTQ